jgi:hypothetical protein
VNRPLVGYSIKIDDTRALTGQSGYMKASVNHMT